MSAHDPRRSPADRRAELLEAARRVLEREGRAALSMRALATEAGVSPMAAYQHFENQLALHLELWASCLEQLNRLCEAAIVDRLDDPGAAFFALCRAILTYAVETPRAFEFVFSDPIIHDVRARREYDGLRSWLITASTDLVRRSVDAGIFRGDMSVEQIQLSALAVTQGFGAQLVSLRSEAFFGVMADRVVELAMRVLREAIIAR